MLSYNSVVNNMHKEWAERRQGWVGRRRQLVGGGGMRGEEGGVVSLHVPNLLS